MLDEPKFNRGSSRKPYFVLKVQLKLHLDNTEIIKLQKLKLLIQFSYFMAATKQIDQF